MKNNRTKNILFLTLTALFLTTSGVFAAASFEGVVTMAITDSRGASNIVFTVKGDRTRLDMLAEGGRPSTTMMMNGATGKATIVMDQMKMYMEHDLSTTPEKAAKALPPPTNTGKTETLLGHACEIWESATNDGGTNMLWLATDMQGYFAMAGGSISRSGETAAARFIREQHKFPMRIVELSAGKEISRIEVVKLEPKSIDAAIFEVPSGYQMMDMHGMH